MAGTDRTKTDLAAALPKGPAVVLVEPQLAENVGAVARAMANFGLSELRVVRGAGKTDDERARARAAGADYVLDAARHFERIEGALADLTLVVATTARERGQAKPVDTPAEGAVRIAAHIGAGGGAGILFGRERTGLENEEVALAARVMTFPVNPAYASLNLAQAVLLVGYEWFKAATGGAAPFALPTKSPPGSHAELVALFVHLEGELREAGFFRSPAKTASMVINLRNMIQRMEPTKQDLQTLHGIVAALVEGRPGPEGRQRTVLKSAEELFREAIKDGIASSTAVPPICSRMLYVRAGDRELDCEVRIFRPFEESEHCWICPYEIDWPQSPRKSYAAGADAVQALTLVMQKIGSEIYTSSYHKDNLLRFLVQGLGYGFGLPRTIRDLLVGDDINM